MTFYSKNSFDNKNFTKNVHPEFSSIEDCIIGDQFDDWKLAKSAPAMSELIWFTALVWDAALNCTLWSGGLKTKKWTDL